jgi:hypothetical protein
MARRVLRVLVTASRTWTDRDAVWRALDERVSPHYHTMFVVHGACEEGGDLHAHQWCEEFAGWWDNQGVTIVEEPHPADWRRYGKAAGPIRNDSMVGLGADECLSFIGPCEKPNCRRQRPHGTHGASHCAEAAEAAGIPVTPHTPGGVAPWWLCPNTPPCPHAAVVHDIYDWGDPAPNCCIDGCTCPAVSP